MQANDVADQLIEVATKQMEKIVRQLEHQNTPLEKIHKKILGYATQTI
jgi:exonuclease VII small subunit